jgi:putative intracellular protease/amidase
MKITKRTLIIAFVLAVVTFVSFVASNKVEAAVCHGATAAINLELDTKTL